MPNQAVADLIAGKLNEGLTHPGDESTGGPIIVAPFTYRTSGMSPEQVEAFGLTKQAKLLGEALVHTVEQDGWEIINTSELGRLRELAAQAETGVATLPPYMSLHCNLCQSTADQFILRLPANAAQTYLVDVKQLIRSIGALNPVCPHTPQLPAASVTQEN
jgi:hypothetical protein